MISFTIPIEPLSIQFSGKRMQIRGGKPVFFKTKVASSYQTAISILAKKYRPKKPLEGALKVDIAFILPRPKSLMKKGDYEGLIPHTKRPDADNLRKGCQDALADFWLDDGQICRGNTAKYYAEKNGKPRIIVFIDEAESDSEEIERAY